MEIRIDGCSCILASGGYPEGFKGEKKASLFSLHTEKMHRGKGAAKRVLRAVRKWADRHGMPVYLNVGPFRDKPMSEGQLISFYITMGWRLLESGSYVMVYKPRGRKCQLQSS